MESQLGNDERGHVQQHRIRLLRLPGPHFALALSLGEEAGFEE